MTITFLDGQPVVEIYQIADGSPMNVQSARSQFISFLPDNPPATQQTLEEFDRFANALYANAQFLTQWEVSQILEALLYAAERHQFQTRKGPEHLPYIIHPIGVARQLLEIGIFEPDVLMAALLHDVVEDTFDASEAETGFQEILQRFGSAVAGYVREVSDDRNLSREERKRLQVEHASHKSPGASAIKLSDKLYNLKDLMRAPPPDWEKERVDAYFVWARQIAERLPTPSEQHLALKRAVLELLG